jgi:transcriptional regulator with XRE-family HTH domain
MKNRDSIAATVGGNIRALRIDRSLTLAELAGQAGISVRTLVEIEGGRANASLATLGGLADALGVDFGRLIQGGESRASRVVRIADAAVLWSDDLGSEARHVLVSREPQSVELLQWILKPGGSYEAKPDPEGTDILLAVSCGALTVTAEGQASELTAETAGLIVSGTGYTLANTGQADTAFTLVHVPPAGRARYTRAVAKLPENALSSQNASGPPRRPSKTAAFRPSPARQHTQAPPIPLRSLPCRYLR